METSNYVRIDDRLLKLTHLSKLIYPAAGFSKADLVTYYRKIGPVVLPYLKNRPFTLHRFPDGVDGDGFHQKSCPSHRPSWIRTGEFEGVHYCLVNDLPSLIWVANLAALELHTGLALIERPQRPSYMVFDLDPGEGAGISECAQAALWIRELLESVDLKSFPKSSGLKGLHLYVPLNNSVTFHQSQELSRRVAEILEILHPAQITSRLAKKLRVGKVLIDWSQNVDFKSTVCVYSLRANQRPTVSTPLAWREVIAASKSTSRGERLATFSPEEVLYRLRKRGDLFEPVRLKVQDLPPLSALELPRVRLKIA